MSEVRLTTDEIRYFALFESMTGAMVRDCMMDEDEETLIYVIKNGDMGLAIGKNGININKVRNAISKPIEVIEHSQDLKEFLTNIFQPVQLKSVNVKIKRGKRIAHIEVKNQDKGLAIGKNGKNIKKARIIVSRHHQIDDVVIEQYPDDV